jgi:di/tricarboxylate transporter
MTLHIASLLLLIVVALVLFALERLPADVIAIGVLLALVLVGLLPPERAFASFGSDAVVLIFGLLVLTATLAHTGVVDMIGRAVLRLTARHPNRLLAVITVAAATLSAFISNTATTALFVPITMGVARRRKVSASRLLMPLAFASILASSVTLVSSSTNVVISGLMTGYDLAPLGMFELTLVGLPIAVVGVLYMLLLGHRLIPDRVQPEELTTAFGVRPYIAEIVVLPDSALVGKTLEESRLGHNMDLTVLRVVREGNRYLAPRARLQLEGNDELLVKGQRDDILGIRDTLGLAIKAEVKLSDPGLQTEQEGLVEAILLPQSPLIGRTLKGTDFRQRYGLQVLGLNRRGKTIYRKLSQVPFRVGDQLLIQGTRANIALHEQGNVYQVLGPVAHSRPNRRKAPIAIAIFGGVLLITALGLISLPVAVLLGTLLVFVTRCITPEEAYRQVAWKALIVIGCMLAIGSAMEHTGAAAYLARQIAALASQAHPLWLLAAFFLLTMALTQPMSNQAAAVVVVPVAIQTALQLGLNPRTFAVLIALGASCSFITPLEPACLMVYGPGRYRFTDYVRAGSGLTVLVMILALALVPLIWPL